MHFAMIGLGRMGGNMALRLMEKGRRIAVWNRSPHRYPDFTAKGARAGKSLEETVAFLTPPRIAWLMIPAGEATETTLHRLAPLLSPGDLLVDGSNGRFQDDVRRAEHLGARSLLYLDAGVSGGIWGRENGYCLMAGGEKAAFDLAEPYLASLAPPGGYLHCGGPGSGHFVKMVHNAIEYAMLQAYGEGFALLEASPYSPSLDFAALTRLWNQGSVIRSWLLELAGRTFAADPRLESIQGVVADSGEGRWAVEQALSSGVPVPAMALSLFARFLSREQDPFSDRFIAALRREFGGHPTSLREGSKVQDPGSKGKK